MKRLFNYKSTVDYTRIRSFNDLQQARHKVDYEILEKEFELRNMVGNYINMLNPVNLISTFYSKFGTFEVIYKGAVKGYHFIKNAIYGNSNVASDTATESGNETDGESEITIDK